MERNFLSFFFFILFQATGVKLGVLASAFWEDKRTGGRKSVKLDVKLNVRYSVRWHQMWTGQ